MRLTGHLDRCDSEQIDGWVIDLDDPGTPIRLEICFGDVVLGEVLADRHRPDLANAGFGEGNCAFVFNPPTRLAPAVLREIKVRIGETGRVFRFGHGPPEPEVAPPAGETDEDPAEPPAKRFQTCILHIGTEHTDAARLQRFLAVNRQTLEDGGYFAPLSLAPHHAQGRLDHSHLATVTMDDDRLDDPLRQEAGLTDQDSLERFRAEVVIAFEAEIMDVPLHCQTLILSSPHCHSRLLDIAEVGFVKDFLDQWCENYSIVVYLRAQHELAIGRYGEKLLRGVIDTEMLPALPPDTPDPSRGYFDYQALIARWSGVFGDAAIHPRIFAPHLLDSGNVIADFMRDIALPEGELKIPDPVPENVSESAQKLLLSLYPYLTRNGPNLIPRLSAATLARFPGDGILPARDKVAAFLDSFKDSNETLRAQFFPDREELFDVDLMTYPEKRDTKSPDRDTLLAMVAAVLVEAEGT